MTEIMKEMPEANEEKKPLPAKTKLVRLKPKATKADQELPEEKPLDKELPDPSELNKEMPKTVNPENVIVVGGKEIEIKPTKIKYQRNRTAAAYRILDMYPLPDVLAMDKGVIDPERDGDQIVFDFLCAVFDDSKLVARYYDSLSADDVDRLVKIFKRLNHIDEKEEAAKNREAKETKR